MFYGDNNDINKRGNVQVPLFLMELGFQRDQQGATNGTLVLRVPFTLANQYHPSCFCLFLSQCAGVVVPS